MSVSSAVFEPLRIGAVVLPNRLVMLPHGTAMLADGAPTADDIAYFEARARTAPGMIITGAAVVEPGSTPRGGKLVRPYDEKALPALDARATALRAHGSVVVGQILHLGRETIGMEVDYAPVAPSPLRSLRDPMTPRPLNLRRMNQIVEGFTSSAYNLLRTGHHGVELHAAHGYLLGQFLSPATNQREDAYGGPLENRMLFLRRVIRAIRDVCGPGFLVGVRLSAEEEVAGGLTLNDSVRIAEALGREGAVSYLSVTAGVRGAYVKDASQPEGVAVAAAAALRRASGLPTLVGQRILRPEMMSGILDQGAADMVGMARGFIADADYLTRWRAGRVREIRPCIAVNQDCRAFAPHLHCAVNPAAGRELNASVNDAQPATRKRKVVVVGGGPAGLEAAVSSARRGHAVVVHERSDRLGGQLHLWAALPTRSEVQRLLAFYEAWLERLHIEVRLNSEHGGAAEADEQLILATGAEGAPLPTGLAEAGARSCDSIIRDGSPAVFGGGLATVVDDGTGFWWTYGAAELLVQSGWRLRLVTPSSAIAGAIPLESQGPLLERLAAGRPEWRPLTRLGRAGQGTLELVGAGGWSEIAETDLLVVQTGRMPVAPASGPEDALRIGDCLTPRRLSQAVLEGRRAGVAV